jgi:hypothetical protein
VDRMKESCIHNFGRDTFRKRQLEILKFSTEFVEIGSDCGRWINLAQDRIQ